MTSNQNPYIKRPQLFMNPQQNFNPYRKCPYCSQDAIAIRDAPFFTCMGGHRFHECPTCLDTRVADVRENVFYCPMLHPYHLCTVHASPVMGVGNLQFNRCSCKSTPLIRQTVIPNWDSPFL